MMYVNYTSIKIKLRNVAVIAKQSQYGSELLMREKI